MDLSAQPGKEEMWTLIAREKRRDKMMRWASVLAWAITLAILAVFSAFVWMQVSQAMSKFEVGLVPIEEIYQILLPFIAVLGAVSLLVAILCTIGVFLRFRSASLTEIQLRLAALEEMLTAAPEGQD